MPDPIAVAQFTQSGSETRVSVEFRDESDGEEKMAALIAIGDGCFRAAREVCNRVGVDLQDVIDQLGLEVKEVSLNANS